MAFLMCAGASLAAQDTDPRAVQPERPTVATHAHTVAPGYFELEAGIEGDRAAAGRRAYAAPLLLKLGLASHLQLNVGAPAFIRSAEQMGGVGDMTIGLKWRLLDDNAVLGDFALLPAIKVPSGSASSGTGTGTMDLGVTAISSYEFGPVAMDLNAGYTRVGAANGIAATRTALWTASFGSAIAGRLSWVAEVFGAPTVDGSGAPSTVEFLTGPTYLVSAALNLDLGVITPLRGDVPNALYVGVVWNMGTFGARSAATRRVARR
ncbi:MAG: transporter [bacterium]